MYVIKIFECLRQLYYIVEGLCPLFLFVNLHVRMSFQVFGKLSVSIDLICGKNNIIPSKKYKAKQQHSFSPGLLLCVQ